MVMYVGTNFLPYPKYNVCIFDEFNQNTYTVKTNMCMCKPIKKLLF